MGIRVRYQSSTAGRPTGIGGKLVASVFGLIFASIGLFFAAFMVRQAMLQVRMQSWTPTRCVIESAEVREVGEQYEFALRYAYEYAGRSYTGERYRVDGNERFDSVSKKQRLLSRYKAGQEAQCYVDPKAPANAVFDRSGSILPNIGGVLFASVFMLIGFGVVGSVWRKPRTSAPATAGATATRQAKWVAVLFCSIFIAIGTIIPFFTFVKPLLRQRDARTWEPVQAVVERSLVKSHRGDDSTTYSVYIAYSYVFPGNEVGGRLPENPGPEVQPQIEAKGIRYYGDRYDFAGGSSGGYDAKAAIVGQHPVGSTLTVYVNPNDPFDSVILRDAGSKIYLGLIPVVFALFGVFFLVVFLRHIGRSATGLTGVAGARGSTSRSARGSRGTSASTTPALKRASSRIGRVLGITFFALFWNGIVSVFLFQVVKEWRTGHKPIFLTLFLTPFVLVGAAAIGGIVREILGLFNPRFELDVPSEPLMPGSTVEVEFHLVGNVQRLVDLRVWLTAREEATYRRGTNSYTDRNEFLKQRLFETKSPRAMETGKIVLAIPEGAMHSFTASNNKIIWSLKVEGAIPRWPDLSEEFIVTVVPKEERPWATKSA